MLKLNLKPWYQMLRFLRIHSRSVMYWKGHYSYKSMKISFWNFIKYQKLIIQGLYYIGSNTQEDGGWKKRRDTLSIYRITEVETLKKKGKTLRGRKGFFRELSILSSKNWMPLFTILDAFTMNKSTILLDEGKTKSSQVLKDISFLLSGEIVHSHAG